uniref:RNA-directed DNA polymerase n=1 Tax=Trichuris muris TaxID=70415 RepID=A0A5S6QQ59_TRIMR
MAYDVHLVYRGGKAMGNADALSRLPLPTDRDRTSTPGERFVNPCLFEDALMMGIEDNSGVGKVQLLDARMVSKLTCKDPVLSRVQHWVLHGWPGRFQGDEFTQFFRHRDELSAVRGCLLWGLRVVIPKKLQNRILDVLHHAHPGAMRMKALARSYVWWLGIDAEIEQWIANCSSCQQHRNDPPKAPPRVWNWTPHPWSRIHIDFAGLFLGKVYLLAVDSHSKWLEVEQVPSMETRECQTMEVRLTQIVFVNSVWLIRLTPHSVTGLSPAEILLRRRPKSLLDRLHPDSLTCTEKSQQEDDVNLESSQKT